MSRASHLKRLEVLEAARVVQARQASTDREEARVASLSGEELRAEYDALLSDFNPAEAARVDSLSLEEVTAECLRLLGGVGA